MPSITSPAPFRSLLAIIGYTGNDPVVLSRLTETGLVVDSRHTTPESAVARATELSGADLFFNINPTRVPTDGQGRGSTADVLRRTALVLDLDIKPGVLPDEATAITVAHAVVPSPLCLTYPAATSSTVPRRSQPRPNNPTSRTCSPNP